SLIHTCESCGGNPFDYLTALRRRAAGLVHDPARGMPWNYRATLGGAAAGANVGWAPQSTGGRRWVDEETPGNRRPAGCAGEGIWCGESRPIPFTSPARWKASRCMSGEWPSTNARVAAI